MYERPPSRPQPGPATQGFWLLPGVRLPPFLELTSLTSSIILEKGVGQYSPRPLVVLDSVVRQSPGYLVLDGYHCLHSLTPFPRVGGGETWLNNNFGHDTRWEAKRHTPPVRENNSLQVLIPIFVLPPDGPLPALVSTPLSQHISHHASLA